MVAVSVSVASLGDRAVVSLSDANRCRYKTGKCTNMRSSKRNGQPHQLCLYHRDKANKIQRKFDRQKRQNARVKKLAHRGLGATLHRSSSSLSTSSTSSGCGGNVLGAQFTTLPAHELDIYSDSDSSTCGNRLSVDSESSQMLGQLWIDLPSYAQVKVKSEPREEPCSSSANSSTSSTPNSSASENESLSVEEINFLCSAVLD